MVVFVSSRTKLQRGLRAGIFCFVTGVPDVTILMFTGMLIGPVLPYKGMWAGSLKRELPAL